MSDDAIVLDRVAASLPVHTPDPNRIAASQLDHFSRLLGARAGCDLGDPDVLQAFCVASFRSFWATLLHWSALPVSGATEPVCRGDRCETARFFPGLRLSYADALLSLAVHDATAPAVTARGADGSRQRLTRGELRAAVQRTAGAFAAIGVRPGDHVIAIARNDAELVIAALAVAALGATLAIAAPDFGPDAIIQRFAPLAPRLLLAHVAARPHDVGLPPGERVACVVAALPGLAHVVLLDEGRLDTAGAAEIWSLSHLQSSHAPLTSFRHFPFDHPLAVLFSSGTTGAPKRIIHGAGGTLLEHVKEHRLHTDLGPGDRLFFHTSAAWMMWNWQLSALASGVEIVLFDGPLAAADTLWRIVAEERVTVFGTSPAYLKLCGDSALAPGRAFDLGALRAILSTGSILHDRQYLWVRDAVKDVALQSVSGGTDIIGCFMLGHPHRPVHAGESQSLSLGIDVRAWDAADGEAGELVCMNPFPSRPLGLHGDVDGRSFHAAYFARHPGIWTHGDLIRMGTQGGVRLLGRCDGVLNVRGIRVGPAEIYAVLQDVPEVRAALAVEQDWEGDSRVVLLVVLQPGAALDGALAMRVRGDLARRASAAHVPDVIADVVALPVTHTGKLSEAAARAAVHGRAVPNRDALANPECLDAIAGHPALRARRDGEAPALRAVWERMLGYAPAGRHDDFFELGGHSLLAARLLAEIRRSTGRELPLATLLYAPTIERLEAVIEDPGWSPTSRLIELRAGTGRPLFLVHSLAGTVLQYWALARALPVGRPVYGIQPRGLDGSEPPVAQVEAMAADYLRLIRTVQPEGPYDIAGFSFGGLVAYEMACRLPENAVGLLGLIDAGLDAACMTWWARFRQARARMAGQLRRVQALPPGERVGYAWRRLAHLVRRQHPAPIAQPAEFSLPLRSVREAIDSAFTAYRPGPYAGPALFLQASVRDPMAFDPLERWRRLITGALVVRRIAGDHEALLATPQVAEVAKHLAR